MMTLKLDMKHICKKEVRRGGAMWTWVGSLGGRRADAKRAAKSSELLWGGNPDVGPRLLLDD